MNPIMLARQDMLGQMEQLRALSAAPIQPATQIDAGAAERPLEARALGMSRMPGRTMIMVRAADVEERVPARLYRRREPRQRRERATRSDDDQTRQNEQQFGFALHGIATISPSTPPRKHSGGGPAA